MIKTFVVMKNPYQSLINSSNAARAFLLFYYVWLQHLGNKQGTLVLPNTTFPWEKS